MQERGEEAQEERKLRVLELRLEMTGADRRWAGQGMLRDGLAQPRMSAYAQSFDQVACTPDSNLGINSFPKPVAASPNFCGSQQLLERRCDARRLVSRRINTGSQSQTFDAKSVVGLIVSMGHN